MRPESVTHRISRRAARQKGLVTRAQLRADEVPEGVIKRAIADAWLHRVHAGVYAVGHPALTPQARWLAAVYALGDDAVLSAVAAGQHWGTLRGHHHLHVTVPPCSGKNRRDGITVHRQSLSAHERTIRHGIPVTTLTRTIIDIAAHAPRELEKAFEEAQIHHRLAPALLAAEVLARPGHRGTARLKALLHAAVDPGQAESILELRLLKLCHTHDLPRPLQQVWIGAHRADFLYPAQRLVIETDGARFHATAAKHAGDKTKTEALEAAGYAVLRLRWADVVHAPAQTAAVIRAALDARAPGRSAAAGTPWRG
jgi:very-short-patch-repair endonuclease